MSEHSPSTHASQPSIGAAPPIIFGTMTARIRGPEGGPWEAVHPAGGNGADPAYFSPTEFSRQNGHDRRVEDARAVRLEDELARRGIKLRGGVDRPCPRCGSDDRFSINVKDQVFNCRGCGGKGRGAIDLVMFLDGSDFNGAVAALAGQAAAPKTVAQPKARPITMHFPYTDETGIALSREVRLQYPDGRKQTWQEAADPDRPGQWITGHGCMDGVRRVPFWLPGLIEALKSGETIFIVEGPRKCGPLHKWGLAATCNMGGSGAASIWREHANEFFLAVYGSPVVILPDNDAPGAKSAATIADFLASVGVAVSLLWLPGLGPKGDIVNWRDAGGTREQFLDLVETEARPWTPSERIEVDSEGFYRNRPQQGAQDAPPEIITRRASDITPETISWLWKYWLARGKLHILGGVPETGKTTIALAYAAIISSGGTWPDGTRAAVGNVLIWTSEDDPADTLVPRLIRMDADLSRIHFIEEAIPPGAKSRPFNPATDMPALVAKAEAIGDVVLLVLDPVVAAMPMTRNSHNNAETRNGMQPVVDFAKAADIATIGIGHLTKGTAGKDPLERLNGSGVFGALPRLVMGAAKNEADAGEDKSERVMVRIKSNIGPSGGGFGYHIDMAALLENPAIEATRIVWEDALEGTARELLNAAEGLDEDDKTSKVAEAMMFLKAALAKGERPAREVLAEAKAVGIAEKTLRRAAEKTTGKRKTALGWHWWWLP